ncbi:MAG: hypothetical protein ACEQSL_09420 [Sediminibacterium sp.]
MKTTFDIKYDVLLEGQVVMHLHSAVTAMDEHEAKRLLKEHVKNKISLMILKTEKK